MAAAPWAAARPGAPRAVVSTLRPGNRAASSASSRAGHAAAGPLVPGPSTDAEPTTSTRRPPADTAGRWPARARPAPDGLHHNDRGYACVAEALASSILRGLRAAAPVVAAGR